MRQKILVIEDHKETRDMISSALESAGFAPSGAGSLEAGRRFLELHRPGLIILDLVLPDGDGLELCRQVRRDAKLSKTPIIALTGLTEFHDKKRGFDSGVDQYLEKPIAMEELFLWARALLRRTNWDTHPEGPVTFGDLRIYPDSYLIRFREAVIGNLTRREFDLLTFLVKSCPKVISRQGIIGNVWKTAAVENLVDTHIYNLRQKLPRALAARIQSVPGKGFRYFHSGCHFPASRE